MTQSNLKMHYDAIIIGSGTCGATIARELCKQNKKVLILERGATLPLKESLLGIGALANEVPVSGKLKDMRALATGGTSSLYFAVATPPPIDTFKSLGIDLTKEYKEALEELPIDYLPDELLGPQSLKLRDSARELGYDWYNQLMFVDQSKCKSGYTYESKWKAKDYVDDAIKDGATIINKAEVTKVITDNKKAIGVEYKLKKKTKSKKFELCKVFGDKIILTAGVLASPIILRNSGVKNVGDRGFYVDPNLVYFGLIPGLKSEKTFVGAMKADLEEDLALGDVNVIKSFYRLIMLSLLKPRHFFSYSNSIGIGVKVSEPLGGKFLDNGQFQKEFSKDVYKKLDKGSEDALKILKNAGAKHIIKGPMNVTGIGGLLRINEHIDNNLQTEFENLYVCDRSFIPDTFRDPPTLTLVCLAKYLANHLLSSNES
ncbi:FAD-dependent oxidoreductase [Kordia algicida OT-1]|uniref:Glucose-methanol-choline oxidoreductase N-terminal domain-containing protein n=1 Tax=Kordia algicida OT-1 TaxID=391587 RepID=A9EAA2_9FLAO|nr:FAD-dependent oxidoreductase [Kordia algicida]EDP94605.1 hypothetical protein KAOT1_04290 [Kordia algicida OT-1]